MRSGIENWIRAAGLVAGVSVAIGALAIWRVPRGTGVLGTDIVVGAAPTGELQVDPQGPFVTANDLRPGSEPASGTVDVRNITGRRLAVRVVASASSRALDGLARIEVDAGGQEIYRGSLGDLRSGSDRAFVLRSGVTDTLTTRVWLPRDVGDAAQGQATQIDLGFRVTAR